MERKFTNEQNKNILYEILLQELKINNDSNWIPQIIQIFKNNIIFFLANANFNNSLLELNKLFLKQTIIAIHKLIPNLKSGQKQINILPDDIIFPHKIEDIRNIRKDLFEEEFNLKKIDFNSSMKLEKPNTIKFSDNYANEKIINMEQLISEKMNERNSQTSENSIKITFNEPFIELNPSENSDAESLNKNKIKKVNFNLKENDEIIPEIKTISYEEQKSVELPTKDELQMHSAMFDNSRNIVPNQFLPMNEFVKKINDLNLKIDNLTKIMNEISSIIQHKEG